MDGELSQALDFLVCLLQDHFGEIGYFDLLAQFLDIGIFFQFSQLFLNSAHSFAQNRFLHVVIEFLLGFVGNFPLDLENLHLFKKTLADPHQPFLRSTSSRSACFSPFLTFRTEAS